MNTPALVLAVGVVHGILDMGVLGFLDMVVHDFLFIHIGGGWWWNWCCTICIYLCSSMCV